MLYLASSSISRVNLLKQTGIKFTQICFDYDENITTSYTPSIYVQEVVKAKERQFCQKFNYDKILFADSIACIQNNILTKALNKEQAYKMLTMQSGKKVDILSAFILKTPQKRIFSLSKTSLFFKEFDQDEMKDYIESGLYKGKAGAIMCEGFHQKYIDKQIGNLNTALGLNTDTLKAYL